MVACDPGPVSYTHLDVYKRQVLESGGNSCIGSAQVTVQEKLAGL